VKRIYLNLIAAASLLCLLGSGAFAQAINPGGGGGGGGGCSSPCAVTQASGSVAAGAYSAGAFATGSFVAGALADGAITTLGTEADTAWVSGSGTAIAILKKIAGNTATFNGAVTIASGGVAAGAYSSGSFVAGALADGAIVTLGTEADTAWASGNGTAIAILKKIATNTAAFSGAVTISGPLGPSTASTAAVAITDTGAPITGQTLGAGGQGLIGWDSQIAAYVQEGYDATTNSNRVISTSNVTPIACGGTATSSASNVANLGTTSIHGFTIQNENATVSLSFSLTGTASIGANNTFTLVGTTEVGSNSYSTPYGFGSNTNVSVIAPSSVVYTCTAW